MFKELGKMASLVKQAGQMRGKVKEVQERLQQIRVEGTAAGGAIRVEMSGLQQVIDCQISPALAQSGDAEMIARLMVVAFNLALEQARKASADAMSKVTEGMDLPGMNELLAGGE
ncbi:MAG: YbaB/EbfC family nucleoid-associated protein [Planctomycetaceae bacterium]|nr:MAG: YbaB/EbfC family nucleoid-associated protein [Planctomycetaceae bacterium]